MATHVVPAGPFHLTAHSAGLVAWKPSRPLVASLGMVYLSPNAQARMLPTNDGRDPLRAMVGAAFDQFLELGTAAHGLFDDSWGRLGIAQMKVMAPKPGARVIGGFVDPMLFIGLELYWRDELNFKATGQRGRIDYKTLGQNAASDWDALLPGVARKPMKEFDHE